MPFFSDYIQPATEWLHAHPDWALLITFLAAFTESLVLIGGIIPGSVAMTAIGIMAGSGVMRIDLTLLVATLGAVCGDGVSYLFGYVYSDKLYGIWPFSRYPGWLTYGKDFFSRHGGKSVVLGRFIGPLRSIIPVIAGMMHMSHWRFFIANVISAVGWAILYVLPGIMIGAASTELSPESATRLFAIVLILIGGIWLLIFLLKYVFIYTNKLMQRCLNYFWKRASQHRQLGSYVAALVPAGEKNHLQTSALLLGLFLSLLSFITLSILVQTNVLSGLNQALFLFFQSLRTEFFSIFFIILTQLTSPITLYLIFSSILLLLLYRRDSRLLQFWLYMHLFCALTLLMTNGLLNSPFPQTCITTRSGSSYPDLGLTFAVTQLVFLCLYLQGRFKNPALGSSLIIILSILCLAPVYSGDHWITDTLGALLCGLSLALFFWLIYRRKKYPAASQKLTALILIPILVIGTGISTWMNLQNAIKSQQPCLPQYVFTSEQWWNQKQPVLPVYRKNRIGRMVDLFNLQYAGSLDTLERALSLAGWQKQNPSLFHQLLNRINHSPFSQEVPLIAQLYLNRKPALVMTYNPGNNNPIQIMRLWRSNYHIKHMFSPVWIGTVHPWKQSKQLSRLKHSSLPYVVNSLNAFDLRSIALPHSQPQSLVQAMEPALLLIRER